MSELVNYPHLEAGSYHIMTPPCLPSPLRALGLVREVLGGAPPHADAPVGAWCPPCSTRKNQGSVEVAIQGEAAARQ
ncbi:hypothetical protein B9Q04_10975 [Candidatus Marsarchaeota G2 archaeon BE_D]|uniref:Uncharacterized protein n=3 Tax=Candidatus Marsarchaeota group 2 TaxID=2203771 RepID=A0A2R6C956_9ARCH|nr:MAG: hypothetical protein B9Q06_00035 [Candidatus Marsarchaeota G2 archaeon ECH_B_2]PSO03284.1 MAG: hypothetical protein B9Q05_00035 [Candidatus Marsarchaeota G2 archaeon ECH_B_1]PSO07427.1 MAG: hypothetical protein B9Q04_10975 [Candidatus Marsarchaeota G2 archaeon BE_D]